MHVCTVLLPSKVQSIFYFESIIRFPLARMDGAGTVLYCTTTSLFLSRVLQLAGLAHAGSLSACRRALENQIGSNRRIVRCTVPPYVLLDAKMPNKGDGTSSKKQRIYGTLVDCVELDSCQIVLILFDTVLSFSAHCLRGRSPGHFLISFYAPN